MEYLLSPMVGFAKSEVLCYPRHPNKGFQRYIYIYTKSTMFPSERVECPPTPYVCSDPTKYQEKTDPLENCNSFRLEEEDIPIASLRSGDDHNRDDSSPLRADSRVSEPLPDDDDSRVSGPVPVQEVAQNGVHVNGVGNSPNYPAENGVVTNGEEDHLSGDNT